jgi:hypothetical protein
VVAIVAIGMCVSDLGHASLASPDPKEALWRQIAALHAQGRSLVLQERRAPNNPALRIQRIQAYNEAVKRVARYRREWVSDRQSITDLRLVYRLGLYMHLSENLAGARRCYAYCRAHLRIREREAIWDDKPLLPQVEHHLKVLDAMQASGRKAGGTASLHVTTFIFAGKGILEVAFRPPPPHTEEQAVEIATRQCTPNEMKRATAIGQSLLQRAGLAHSVVAQKGMVVFAVDGTAEEARYLSHRLHEVGRMLQSRYFNRPISPSLLYVYANLRPTKPGGASELPSSSNTATPPARLSEVPANSSVQSPLENALSPQGMRQEGDLGKDPQSGRRLPEQHALFAGSSEDVGRKLSMAIHYRDMCELEGYYEPLDNSIVLRKRLRGPKGEWYLGTAVHELVHALMRADFPLAPRWLDEGMAAAYEVQDSQGPTDNYRLIYLIEAGNQQKFPSLAEVLDSGAPGWSNERQALLTAAARYLCLYLLHGAPGRNRLQAVYATMRHGNGKISAEECLQRVTKWGLPDLEKDFRRFVESRDVDMMRRHWEHLNEPIKVYTHKLASH